MKLVHTKLPFFPTHTTQWAVFILLSILAQPAYAEETLTNENLSTVKHPKPLVRTSDVVTLHQIPLEGGGTLIVTRNTVHGVQLWKFETGKAFWWVSPKGVIYGKGTHKKSDPLARFDAENENDAYRIYTCIEITDNI